MENTGNINPGLEGLIRGGPLAETPAGKPSTSLLSRIRFDLLAQNYFVIQDFPWAVTSLYSLGQHAAGGTDDPGMQASFGLTSVFNFVFAPLGILSQVRNFIRARKIGDFVGQLFSGLLIGRFIGSFVSAAVGVPAKMITLINTARAGVVSTAALPVLQKIGASCFGFVSLMLIIPFAIKGLLSIYQFSKISDDAGQAYAYLKSQLEISDDEKEKIRALKPENLPKGNLTDEERAILTAAERDASDSLAVKKAIALQKLSKQASFDRVVGVEAREALVAAMKDSNTIDEARMGEVVQVAKTGSQRRALINIAWLALFLLGLTSFILSVVATGGGTLLAGMIISAIISVGMTALDSYDLASELSKKHVSKESKIMIGMINIVIAICTAVASALSAGLAPLLISAIGGTLLLLLQLIITYIISGKQE